jgi:hypothetical protein
MLKYKIKSNAGARKNTIFTMVSYIFLIFEVFSSSTAWGQVSNVDPETTLKYSMSYSKKDSDRGRIKPSEYTIEAFQRLKIIPSKPTERRDYNNYYLVTKPIYLFGNKIIALEDEVMERWLGCCFNPGIGVLVERGSQYQSLLNFAKNNRCSIKAANTTLEAVGLKHLIDNDKYVLISCTEGDAKDESLWRSKSISYRVDNISIGAEFNPSNNNYASFKCSRSSTFYESFWCSSKFSQIDSRNRKYSISSSLVFNQKNGVTYINREIRPAYVYSENYFKKNIEDATRMYGKVSQFLKYTPFNNPNTREHSYVYIWGDLSLIPLNNFEIEALTKGKSPRAGILLHTSAKSLRTSTRNNINIFRITGTSGYIQQYTFDTNGKGIEREFAISPTKMQIIGKPSRGVKGSSSVGIPQKYQGVYMETSTIDKKNITCKSSDFGKFDNNPYGDRLYSIDSNSIRGHEFFCNLISSSQQKSNLDQDGYLYLVLSCGQESMSWKSRNLWFLKQYKTDVTLVDILTHSTPETGPNDNKSNEFKMGYRAQLFTKCR